MSAAPILAPELRWRDVDPRGRTFDVSAARAIAERHVRWAVGDDLRRRAPLPGRDRELVEAAIDRDLLAYYGAWIGGWRWSADEPGCGGPMRAWCCASDSILAREDGAATIDRVVAAVTAWHAFLVELARRFDELRVETGGRCGADAIEQAAAALLPDVIAWTDASDAWYATFARILSWYLETVGLDGEDIEAAVNDVASGRFASWIAPSDEVVRAATDALASAVSQARDTPAEEDALAAWLANRERAFARAPAAVRALPGASVDGHRAFIDGRERERDPQRAARMARALDACRASAAREEPLTFERLAGWQALVLEREHPGFRTTDAFAHGGRHRYGLGPDTAARFGAALSDANDESTPALVRAARVYLDVCFFHPFEDGNARAARLALDHVLTRAGLRLVAAEPVFVIARSARDPHAGFRLSHLLAHVCAPEPSR